MEFTVTFWHGETTMVAADSLRAAFELNFGGPVTKTGYNEKGVWLAVETPNKGFIYNTNGDHCATIEANA